MGRVSAAAYHQGRFLQEQELLAEYRHCPWCRFDGTRQRVLEIQRSPDVWLLECPRCHAVSASRPATDAALAAYYASYYAESAAIRVTCGNPRHHARHICRHARALRRLAMVNLLDYGGGDGSIGHAVALELLKAGCGRIDLLVVDYNDRLIQPAHPAIALSHASALEQVPRERNFDLVMAGAILEHLPEPADVTRRLLQSLSPGGFFYARTPNVVSLLRVSSRMGISYDFTFPAHFHDLGQSFWENVLPALQMAGKEWVLVGSRPSVVETSFSDKFLRTLVSYAIKAPWWLLGKFYPFTGGWEVFIRRSVV